MRSKCQLAHTTQALKTCKHDWIYNFSASPVKTESTAMNVTCDQFIFRNKQQGIFPVVVQQKKNVYTLKHKKRYRAAEYDSQLTTQATAACKPHIVRAKFSLQIN